ncbi:15945_t:CDS:2 [Funneliformis mosseae]|uniref:15945_t:CDS:1 n=1 Tax=Funneliformis mosseae TaxID=27381 RepID=A0A9N9DI82_FUNMO|nr:15945_t:CDS:2 [Funneliformis mosseae]
MKLIKGLKLIQPRATSGSLASYDNFESDELVRFRQIYCLKVKNTITGAEPFLGVMMYPKKIDVGLPDNIYSLLVNYYNAVYGEDLDFFLIFRHIQIGAEIFGFAIAPQFFKNGSIEIYPG